MSYFIHQQDFEITGNLSYHLSRYGENFANNYNNHQLTRSTLIHLRYLILCDKQCNVALTLLPNLLRESCILITTHTETYHFHFMICYEFFDKIYFPAVLSSLHHNSSLQYTQFNFNLKYLLTHSTTGLSVWLTCSVTFQDEWLSLSYDSSGGFLVEFALSAIRA